MKVKYNNSAIKYIVNNAIRYYYSYDKLCSRLEYLGFKQNYKQYNYLKLHQSENDVVYVKKNIMVIIGIYNNSKWQLDAVVKFNITKKEYFSLIN